MNQIVFSFFILYFDSVDLIDHPFLNKYISLLLGSVQNKAKSASKIMIFPKKMKLFIFFIFNCKAQLEIEENLVPMSEWSLSLTTEETPLKTTTAELRESTIEIFTEKSFDTTTKISENYVSTTIQVLALN